MAGTPHADQSLPYEWSAVTDGDRTFIVRSLPEGGTAECFVVSAVSRNARTFAQADAVLYEGTVVEPVYDESLRSFELVHDYGGRMARHHVGDWLEEPAVRLKRLPTTDIQEAI